MPTFNIKNDEDNTISVSNSVSIGNNCEITFNPTPRKTASKNNEIIIGENCGVRYFRIIIRGSNNLVSIGDGTTITGTIMIEGSNLKVSIGKYCTINGLFITCRDQDVLIGNECLISNEVKIRSSDSHKLFSQSDNQQINLATRPVTIGNHVWIGQDVYIGKNSHIADGCVIAARATVTKEITTPNCVIGGYSKILRNNIRWEK